MSLRRRPVENATALYLRGQLDLPDTRRVKIALQEMASMQRKGYLFQSIHATAIENAIIGRLYTMESDRKVRRWGINVLALLGKEANCREVVVRILERYPDDPDTVAAGIAAIFKLSRKPNEVLKRLNFDQQMMNLAALQYVDAEKLNLSSFPVDIETATPAVLRQALIVVGIGRANENMFNPRHANATIIKALGAHHDPLVAQYSVWAITENDTLSISDLGISLKNIEYQPSNVRAWMYQLIGMTPASAVQNIDIIQTGIADPDAEIRRGLALGLKQTHFDGLEEVMIDWFSSEANQDVREVLLDHLVKFAHIYPVYEEWVWNAFDAAPSGSAEMLRMQMNASKTPTYAKMQVRKHASENDLFGKGYQVTNNFNIGNIQAGAVAVGAGSSSNVGEVSNFYKAETVEKIQEQLSKAELHIADINEKTEETVAALESIKSARIEPSPDRVNKAIAMIEKVATTTNSIVENIPALTGVVTSLQSLVGSVSF